MLPKSFRGPVCCMAAGLLAGCAKPPLDQIEATKQQVRTSLEQSQAVLYAPEAVRALQDSLAVVDDLVARESQRLFFLRKYDSVLPRLANIDVALRGLAEAVQRGKESMRAEVTSRLDLAAAIADSAEAEFHNAPAGKDARAALALLHSELAAAHSEIDQARSSVQVDKVAQARDEAGSAQEHARRVLDDLRSAKAKVHVARNHASRSTRAQGTARAAAGRARARVSARVAHAAP